MDDLTQELGKTKLQLAAWKLRYYVEYFRLDGTKKFVKELQDQHSFKDEETSRLNSYIDNIVEQNQQRVDFFTAEVEKKEQRAGSFLRFLTRSAAVVGGMFTVAGMLDSAFYHTAKLVKAD